MKKYSIFIFLVSLPTLLFSQSNTRESLNLKVRHEISYFIDTVKAHYAIANGKFAVYTMRINYANEDTLCFSMGTIENQYEYKYVSPKYMMSIDSEFILINGFEQGINIDTWVQKLHMNKINNIEKEDIMSKLYKNEAGGIISEGPGFVCCIADSNRYRSIYENTNQMPQTIYNKQIFPTPKLKLIYDPLWGETQRKQDTKVLNTNNKDNK